MLLLERGLSIRDILPALTECFYKRIPILVLIIQPSKANFESHECTHYSDINLTFPSDTFQYQHCLKSRNDEKSVYRLDYMLSHLSRADKGPVILTIEEDLMVHRSIRNKLPALPAYIHKHSYEVPEIKGNLVLAISTSEILSTNLSLMFWKSLCHPQIFLFFLMNTRQGMAFQQSLMLNLSPILTNRSIRIQPRLLSMEAHPLLICS